MIKNEYFEEISGKNETLYIYISRDENVEDKDISTVLISLHGMVNRSKSEFPSKSAHRYKKHLPSDWICVTVSDPLVFCDENIRGSFFLGSNRKTYLSNLKNFLVKHVPCLNFTPHIIINTMSASGIAGLNLANYFKGYFFGFAPIFYIKNYYRSFSTDLANKFWSSNLEMIYEYNDLLIRDITEISKIVLVCNQSDYNHNFCQTLEFFRSTLIYSPEQSAKYAATKMTSKIDLQIGDIGKGEGHQIPHIFDISDFIYRYINDGKANFFDTLSKDEQKRRYSTNTKNKNILLKSITDLTWN